MKQYKILCDKCSADATHGLVITNFATSKETTLDFCDNCIAKLTVSEVGSPVDVAAFKAGGAPIEAVAALLETPLKKRRKQAEPPMTSEQIRAATKPSKKEPEPIIIPDDPPEAKSPGGIILPTEQDISKLPHLWDIAKKPLDADEKRGERGIDEEAHRKLLAAAKAQRMARRPTTESVINNVFAGDRAPEDCDHPHDNRVIVDQYKGIEQCGDCGRTLVGGRTIS